MSSSVPGLSTEDQALLERVFDESNHPQLVKQALSHPHVETQLRGLLNKIDGAIQEEVLSNHEELLRQAGQVTRLLRLLDGMPQATEELETKACEVAEAVRQPERKMRKVQNSVARVESALAAATAVRQLLMQAETVDAGIDTLPDSSPTGDVTLLRVGMLLSAIRGQLRRNPTFHKVAVIRKHTPRWTAQAKRVKHWAISQLHANLTHTPLSRSRLVFNLQALCALHWKVLGAAVEDWLTRGETALAQSMTKVWSFSGAQMWTALSAALEEAVALLRRTHTLEIALRDGYVVLADPRAERRSLLAEVMGYWQRKYVGGAETGDGCVARVVRGKVPEQFLNAQAPTQDQKRENDLLLDESSNHNDSDTDDEDEFEFTSHLQTRTQRTEDGTSRLHLFPCMWQSVLSTVAECLVNPLVQYYRDVLGAPSPAAKLVSALTVQVGEAAGALFTTTSASSSQRQAVVTMSAAQQFLEGYPRWCAVLDRQLWQAARRACVEQHRSNLNYQRGWRAQLKGSGAESVAALSPEQKTAFQEVLGPSRAVFVAGWARKLSVPLEACFKAAFSWVEEKEGKLAVIPTDALPSREQCAVLCRTLRAAGAITTDDTMLAAGLRDLVRCVLRRFAFLLQQTVTYQSAALRQLATSGSATTDQMQSFALHCVELAAAVLVEGEHLHILGTACGLLMPLFRPLYVSLLRSLSQAVHREDYSATCVILSDGSAAVTACRSYLKQATTAVVERLARAIDMDRVPILGQAVGVLLARLAPLLAMCFARAVALLPVVVSGWDAPSNGQLKLVGDISQMELVCRDLLGWARRFGREEKVTELAALKQWLFGREAQGGDPLVQRLLKTRRQDGEEKTSLSVGAVLQAAHRSAGYRQVAPFATPSPPTHPHLQRSACPTVECDVCGKWSDLMNAWLKEHVLLTSRTLEEDRVVGEEVYEKLVTNKTD